MPASPLRAIFFDAGNTLVRIDYAAIAAALSALGVRVAPADVQRAEWQARVRFDTWWQRAASTETPAARRQYLTFVLEGLGITDAATVEALDTWRRDYNLPFGYWDVPDPDAPAALALCRRAGLRVGVISNSNGTIRALLEKVGLARDLDFVLDSSEVGVEKPDPRIFALALETAGVKAAETVYIGDFYSVDVLGARAAGLDAVLVDPGQCWGERDCLAARGPLDAVRLVLQRRASVAVAGGTGPTREA